MRHISTIDDNYMSYVGVWFSTIIIISAKLERWVTALLVKG